MARQRAQWAGAPGGEHRAGTAYRRLLSHVKPYWRVLGGAVVAMAVYASTDAAFAWLMQPMLDGSFIHKDPDVIEWIPYGIIGVFAVRAVGGFFSSYGMAWIARRVIRDLREAMFRKLLRLPAGYYDTTSSGVILSKILYDVEQVATASSSAITVLVRDTFTILGLLGLMFYKSAFLTTVFVVIAPVLALIVAWVSKRFRKLARRIQASMGDVSHVSEEALEGNRVIKIFGGQGYEEAQFNRANEYNRRQQMKLTATQSFSTPFIQLLVALAFAVIVYLATLPAMVDSITAGTFVSFITAMVLLMQPVRRLTQVNAVIQQGIAAAQSVFGFVDLREEQDHGTQVLDTVGGEVEFKGVSFAYAEDKGPVLQDIDLHIPAGKTVAFVGRSGAGKSTLVSLLPRFYEVSEGGVFIDGHDAREVRLDSLRQHIALVSQSVTLFNDTIAHNIAYGALGEASEEDVRRAARSAHALDFIERLPEGFNTIVGDNGVLLSGGQRQRLAIARALLKNAPILILDEATSALDTESERHIQAALEDLMRDRTTLVIAHRLSTIEKADLIVVVDNGRIIEQGRHDELLARDGAYAALYRLQFREPHAARE